MKSGKLLLLKKQVPLKAPKINFENEKLQER